MKQNFGRTMYLLALRYGDKEALVNVERNRRFSFKELHRLSNRVANALGGELGLCAGDKFLTILENDNLSLVHFPALFKQEATGVYTNYRDSIEEHRWQVALVKPKVAFIETALVDTHAEMLAQAGASVVVMDRLTDDQARRHPKVRLFWEIVDRAPDTESEVILDAREHVAMLRFTGGTTGRGKCAIYSMDNWLSGRDNALASRDLEFDTDARMLHVAPLSHGTMLFFLPTLFAGGTNVTLNAVDLNAFSDAIEREKITHSFVVPTVLYRLLELQRVTPRELGSLRTVIYGAAPMNPGKLNELVTCFGQVFVQAYAATEAPICISTLAKTDHARTGELDQKRLSSAGQVSAGVEVFVADEAGKPLPLGSVGEIIIRSRSVIAGYLDNPQSTSAEFVDGAWRSGDLGYLDEAGFIFIVDRLKDMIITGGFNVYAVEVETALGSHPAVLNSAVVGIPHEEWGEAVHAEVVLRAGSEVTVDALLAHVKERIGSFKAPKSIVFVDQLPTSVVGKVLRREVREKYWTGRDRSIS